MTVLKMLLMYLLGYRDYRSPEYEQAYQTYREEMRKKYGI